MYGTKGLFSEERLRHRNTHVAQETQVIERESFGFNSHQGILGRPTDIVPAHLSAQKRLEFDAVEFTITKQNDLGGRRQQGTYLFEQGNVGGRRRMPFRPCHNYPRQRDSPLLVEQV